MLSSPRGWLRSSVDTVCIYFDRSQTKSCRNLRFTPLFCEGFGLCIQASVEPSHLRSPGVACALNHPPLIKGAVSSCHDLARYDKHIYCWFRIMLHKVAQL